MMSDKIRRHHLDRRAIPYVRQSSSHQVLHNRESRALQYAMRERLVALGWSEIEIIDDDLGRSAAGSVLRAGFERMVAEVCFANADLSRLIRSGMAKVYSIRCGMPLDTSSTKQILVWNITKDGRGVNYVVKGRLVQGGEVIKSAWTDVIGLEAAPYGIFMRTISSLALRLLPPATETRARLLSDCS